MARFAFVAVILIAGCGKGSVTGSAATPSNEEKSDGKPKDLVTRENYEKIMKGMSVAEVEAILGSEWTSTGDLTDERVLLSWKSKWSVLRSQVKGSPKLVNIGVAFLNRRVDDMFIVDEKTLAEDKRRFREEPPPTKPM